MLSAQQLLVENANLKADIRRLRMENTDLVRKTGHVRASDAYMRVSTLDGTESEEGRGKWAEEGE